MSVVEAAAGLIVAGKYRLLERIGAGGMSEVYRAENTLIGRTVALKLLHPEQANDKNLAARLFQEAQSVSRIRHPGIVDVLDAGQGETGPFIVMEYLEGESAARVLSRHGKVGIAAALGTVLPVLDALEAAHNAGIIHRDLKPENVFYSVRDDGHVEVKLLDFGVAKMLWPEGPAPQTSTGVVFGTPDYLSPEQANGEQMIDGRSDLFSVGVLLFELLTNKRPFHAPTAVATAYKVAHARTPLLADHGGPNDPVLDAVLGRVLAKRPDERHSSAADLARELGAHAPPAAEMQEALRDLVPPPRGSRVDRASRTSFSPPISVSSQPTAPIISRRATPREPTPISAITPGGTRRSADLLIAPRARSPLGMRSLASRFVGQCHTRGLAIRAVDAYITRRAGTDGRARTLDKLAPEHSRDLREGMVQAIVFYDLAVLDRYLDAADELFSEGPGWCRTAGADAVTAELAPVLRMALRPGDAATLLRRVIPVCSRLFDFGLWEVVPDGADAASVRITDFEPASLLLRHWLLGVLEGSLRSAGREPTVTIARGDAAYAPQLIADFATRAAGG